MVHHPSFSSALKVDAAGGSTYVAIGQVKDISGPNISRGTIDTSDHDVTSGYRTFLPGLVDGGDVSFSIGWDPTSTLHQQGVGTGLLGDMELSGCTLAAWELTLNTCTGTHVWTFDGFVTGFSPGVPVEGELTADVSVKVSGKPSLS